MTTDTDGYLRTTNLRPPFLGLATQINEAYVAKMFPCVDLLTRKLVESLVIDILLKNPGIAAVWVDPKKNIRRSLHYMLTRLWDLMNTAYKQFIPQYADHKLKELRNISWEAKKIGDTQAHALLTKATKETADNRQEGIQDLMDFMLDLREKIPENVQLVLIEEKSEKGGLPLTIEYPKALPSVTEMGSAIFAPFDITFTVNPPAEMTECKVVIASTSQAVVFEIEPPFKRWKWVGFRLRKVEVNLSLSNAITTSLNLISPTEFVFHGFYRKDWLRPLQREIVFNYRLSGRSSSMPYDTGKRRFTISIGQNRQGKDE